MKFSLYMEVGNMEDINNMSMKDFDNLNRYLEYRHNKNTGQPVELSDMQKQMIQNFKDKEKKNN